MNTNISEILSTLPPKDQAIIQHSLHGGSVIDWSRLFFGDIDEVKKFLKVNEFDLSRPKDEERLITIHQEAIDYLKNHLSRPIADTLSLAASPNIQDIFLKASSNTENKESRQSACAILKTMNIIQHIDGRELLYNCPISLKDLFSLVEDKVERSLSALNRTGNCPIHYEGGRKTKESLITKLLSKRETIAAKINDRVRYRITTKTSADILKVILHLFDTILPFNYVIPDSSVNQLLTLPLSEALKDIEESLASPEKTQRARSDFSGKSYKVCKFVVDIPVRLDNFLALSGSSAYRKSLGTIAYVLVEFQVVDEATAQNNNAGDSSHENYKNRQKSGVVKRLGS